MRYVCADVLAPLHRLHADMRTCMHTTSMCGMDAH